MSFGPKLDPLSSVYLPGEEVVVTLLFSAEDEAFERHGEIYVEEPTGIRAIKISVKSASQDAAS